MVGKQDLTNAVAISSLGGNIMRIAGPSLAGALIGGAGVASCFLFQGVCYVFAAVITLFIRPATQAVIRTASFVDSLLGGFAYARHHRTIILLLVVATIPSIFVYPYVGFVPVVAKDVLHVGAVQYGILMTAVGVGSIPGALLAANMTNAGGKGRTMVVTGAGYMAMIAAFALSPWFWIAFACLVVAGVFNAVSNTFNATLLQFAVSDEYRGRVSALYFMTGGLQPFGSLAMGAMIDGIGAPFAIASLALTATASMIGLALLSPRLRDL